MILLLSGKEVILHCWRAYNGRAPKHGPKCIDMQPSKQRRIQSRPRRAQSSSQSSCQAHALRTAQVEDVPGLPSSLHECQHFINLTNGVEAMPLLTRMGLQHSFCRIQSTALEQKRFEVLMSELDANLLLSLALGKICLVYDLGSRNRVQGVPKAVWYGLEFIRYALEMLWMRRSGEVFLRGVRCTANFQKYLEQLSTPLTRRLKYYRRFMDPNLQHIQLYGVFKLTTRDGDLEFHRNVAMAPMVRLPSALGGAGASMGQREQYLLPSDTGFCLQHRQGCCICYLGGA
ncbi:hypothetical protein WJX84_010876 [Apatococcus fuscideae]|uniref:Uncharacterized protein n=1 Tax=Apatococcus fuscideae TaxID=2026836 RepID=A0AAW1SPH8_9CHLO